MRKLHFGRFYLLIGLMCCLLIPFITVSSYAGTKTLSKKSFTKVVGIESGGWITFKVNLKGNLTYKDSKSKRTFTKEDYFMYATSPNDKVLVNKAKVRMGIMELHAGGKVFKCYKSSGKYPYYVDPAWVAHSRIVSKTRAIGKLKGKSYAKLGFSISGSSVVTPRSGSATWENIAK